MKKLNQRDQDLIDILLTVKQRDIYLRWVHNLEIVDVVEWRELLQHICSTISELSRAEYKLPEDIHIMGTTRLEQWLINRNRAAYRECMLIDDWKQILKNKLTTKLEI